MQLCNLSPTQSQTHLEFERTRPHTGDTQDVWSPKRSSQGPFLKAVAKATHWHSTFLYPSEGHQSQRCPGRVVVCARKAPTLDSQLIPGDVLEKVYAFIQDKHTHKEMLKTTESHPWEKAVTSIAATNTSVCTSPGFRSGSFKRCSCCFAAQLKDAVAGFLFSSYWTEIY